MHELVVLFFCVGYLYYLLTSEFLSMIWIVQTIIEYSPNKWNITDIFNGKDVARVNCYYQAKPTQMLMHRPCNQS